MKLILGSAQISDDYGISNKKKSINKGDIEKIINLEQLKVFERIRDLKFYENKLYLYLEDTASIGIINMVKN